MKWRNKGHEFDKYAEELVQNFRNKGSRFYIFGAGMIGGEIRAIIEKTGCFAGFIDNDKEKQLSGINGAKVLSLQGYLEQGKKGLIIIAADKKNISIMMKQLESAGLKKEKDFYVYANFMKNIFPILSVYVMDMLYIELAQICLTERCSLKCKKCAHACYAVEPHNQDMSIDMAKKSADMFFSHVDIIKEFVLIGGEPFLYKNLGEIIEYIGKNYRENIVTFSITTNGTIMPDKFLLDLCRKYDVLIRISDYSETVKRLEKNYVRLMELLQSNQVLYTMSDKKARWMDYGFEVVDRNWREDELIRVFEQCKTPCREIRGSRFYYCVMARSVSDNLKLGLGEKDYLNLEGMEQKDREIILEYQMGFSEKGYLDMCNHCRGADAGRYPIPMAEQLSFKENP